MLRYIGFLGAYSLQPDELSKVQPTNLLRFTRASRGISNQELHVHRDCALGRVTNMASALGGSQRPPTSKVR